MDVPSEARAQKLLILDDEAAMGLTIANIARSAGFEAHALTDPDAFFAAVTEWVPSHIALDLVMPHVDGIEVLRRLADVACRANIILTSGVGSRVLEAAKQSALEHGLSIAGVVSKPFTPTKFRSLLNSAALRQTRPIHLPNARPEVAITALHLETAVQEHQLSLAYQPKVHCRDGSIAGFEALARWHHPELGFIPPDRFILAAEALGLIDHLTDYLFERAFAWFSQFDRNLGYKLSLNVSRRSLGDIGFADRVASQCQLHDLAPGCVILEITETAALADPTTSLDLLTRLRFKGFRLSIDDFGIGYSSIAQLVRLPFSELKIDKSFVMNAATSSESRTLIRAMVGLAHNLELEVTAEGVEDETALDLLREARCDLAQGYHIARPMAAKALAEWLDGQEIVGASSGRPTVEVARPNDAPNRNPRGFQS